MDVNEHDLLIELNTKVNILISQQTDWMRTNNSAILGLSERVSALETKDSRDSEKVHAIDTNVQRSLQNYEKITALETEVQTIKEDIKDLKTKSNLWDILNGFGIAVAAIIGYFR